MKVKNAVKTVNMSVTFVLSYYHRHTKCIHNCII